MDGNGSQRGNNQILAGLNVKPSNLNEHGASMSRHDDISQDQFSGVDFLMDENILTNESREEEDGRIIRTPNNNLKN